jgi:uncharacterized protein YjbJ (UPF0337 family)
VAQEPDRLRQDIEDTRASLTHDVDMLAEKTSPKQVAQRRWTAAKEKVMGSSAGARHSAEDKLSTAQDKASDLTGKAGSAVSDAPKALTRQTQGNPLAAGIIAFGAGMLAATLIPVTDMERRGGQQLKDNAGDLPEKVRDVAMDAKDDLSGRVQHAAGEVKETAREAAQTTTDQARSGAQDVKDEAKSATS